MQQLADFALYLNCFIFAITLFNLLTVRVVSHRDSQLISNSVSILIPLRNESSNVSGVLHSALNQRDIKDFEVLALDDNSTDDTYQQLNEITAPNLKILSGQQLPDGWLGKNYACYQLAQHSNGDYLVFVDADVRLDFTAIASSIHLMQTLKWDFISPYPRQIAISFLERLAQPLLQWSWFASLPLRLAEILQKPSMVVANGQFLIIKREPYFAINGHQAVRQEVLDDLELGRTLVRKGFRGGVAVGSKVAECRMYNNSTELIQGYTKSQWRAFANPMGAALVIALLLLTSVLPLIYGLSGSLTGWLGYFAIVSTRLLVAAKTRSTISTALLHPLSALLWSYLIINSWIAKRRGALVWRGRSL